jgi:hypothetical protein
MIIGVRDQSVADIYVRFVSKIVSVMSISLGSPVAVHIECIRG